MSTRFLLARIHRARLRELVACPRCGDEYFADLNPNESEPQWLQEDEWEALVRLDEECPDHAHRFVVGE